MRDLSSDDPDVRLHAIVALGAIGPAASEAVPALLALIQLPDAELQRLAVHWQRSYQKGILRQGQYTSGSVLVNVLPGQSTDEQMVAGDLERPPAAIDFKALLRGNLRLSMIETLARIGPGAQDATPTLLRLLADDDVHDRAAYALTQIGPPVVPALLESLKSSEPEMQIRITETLGRMGAQAQTSIPVLIDLLNDERLFGSAAAALGKMGPASVPSLMLALTHTRGVGGKTDTNYRTRQGAAEALGDIGSAASQAVPALIESLKDQTWTVRMEAGMALSKIDREAAASALLQVLDDRNPYIRSTAAATLGQIRPVVHPAIPALLRRLGQDENKHVRIHSATALSEMVDSATPEAVPALLEALKDSRNKDEFLQRQIIHALGSIGAQAHEAVPTLTELMHDSNVDVRSAASLALSQIQPAAKSSDSPESTSIR